MKNRWSDAARFASAAVRYSKYGPMMGMQPWGDNARAAAAAARAERAALAGGMSPSEAVDVALDARYGEGYLSGEASIDPTLGIGRERVSSGSRRVPSMSDAAPFEARKASYERAFREWWKGVQATEQNIAAFHAFVAAMGGAAAGAMGSYRQATGEQPVAGMSRVFGRAGSYLSGDTPMFDESGVLAGWAKTGAARYGRTSRPVGRQPMSKAANLRFDLGRAKVVDPTTGKTVGRAAYSSDGDWPIPKSDMRAVKKAYDMGIQAFSFNDGMSLEQALRETGIVAGSEEAYMFQKGWQDAPAVMDAAESDGYEPYSIEREESEAVMADYGPENVYNYGVGAFRDGVSLSDALREAGIRPGTEAAYAVEKGYNDATALEDPEDADDGSAAVAEERLGDEYAQYLDEVNALRDESLAEQGLDPQGHPPAARAGSVREAALARSYASGRSAVEPEDAFNELALMREPLYDKGRFGGRREQYARAMAVQREILELGRREGDSEHQADARDSLSAAFGAIARGEDASSFIAQAEAVAADLANVPPYEAPGPRMARPGDIHPHVMDLPGGGNFDEASEMLPDGVGADFTPEQRAAARELGVLEGQWGVNSMVERMVPPQLLDEYEAGVAEGRQGPSENAHATPADRAAVVRAARAYLDGRIGDDEDGGDFPDHLNDRWNLGDYASADGWASRNKEGIEKGLAAAVGDERGQYADAALVKAGLDWLGNAVASGDTPAADAAVAYLSDLLGNVRAGKDKPVPAALTEYDDDEDGAGGDDGADLVDFDEEGEGVEGEERFFEDSFADPDMPLPWEYEGNNSFRKWFPGVKNRSSVANRIVAMDMYRESGLENAWSDAARAASAAVRLAKYGPMMGLQPWGDEARATAAAARGAKWGGGGGSSSSSGGYDDYDDSGGSGSGGEGYSSDSNSGVTLASASSGGSRGGGKSKQSRNGGSKKGGWRGASRSASAAKSPINARAKFEAHGFDSLNAEQRKALFDDIKKRAEAGEDLTESDMIFLGGFEAFLDKEMKETTPAMNDAYEIARAKFRLKHGRDPETDDEWAEAEELGGVPESQRAYGAPEPKDDKKKSSDPVEAAREAYSKKYGRDPETDDEWAEAEGLGGVPENERGNGDPAPFDRSKAVVGEVRYGWDGGGNKGKGLREAGIEQFRKETGREPVTGADYDRVDALGGVPKDEWWDVALHDDNAPADAGIGRERAKAIAAAGDAAREAKAAGRKAGVPGGDPPAHWSEAAKRRFRERQEDAIRQAGKEARAAKLREERAARTKARNDLYTADWFSKAFTDIRPKRVKDSGEARAMRLAEERRQRRAERERYSAADWLEGGMPAAKGGVRDGLTPAWDRRVPASSAAGFGVSRKPQMTYLGGGRFVGPDGREFVSASYGKPRESADGAIFYQGKWFDKKTGKALKAGAKV
jgi:hypothetical protein